MMVELLLEFADGAMRLDDTTKALTRMETLHAATYKDLLFTCGSPPAESGSPTRSAC